MNSMKEIKAKEGYYLTQAAEVEDRLFLTAIKGANINESDWREATIEEKEAYENYLNDKMKNNLENNNE